MKLMLLLVFMGACVWNCTKRGELGNDCNALVEIDSFEFSRNYIRPLDMTNNSPLRKVEDSIVDKDNNYVFVDNLGDEDFREYAVLGKLKSWHVVRCQGYHDNVYYLMGKGRMDTLHGFPKLYNRTLVCIEEPYTDSQEAIEIWDVGRYDALMSMQKFSLKKCYEYRIIDSYVYKNKLYLKTGLDYGEHKYYKIRFR